MILSRDFRLKLFIKIVDNNEEHTANISFSSFFFEITKAMFVKFEELFQQKDNNFDVLFNFEYDIVFLLTE